jgi:hypothetical protein
MKWQCDAARGLSLGPPCVSCLRRLPGLPLPRVLSPILATGRQDRCRGRR